jgi:hypothetical protein
MENERVTYLGDELDRLNRAWIKKHSRAIRANLEKAGVMMRGNIAKGFRYPTSDAPQGYWLALERSNSQQSCDLQFSISFTGGVAIHLVRSRRIEMIDGRYSVTPEDRISVDSLEAIRSMSPRHETLVEVVREAIAQSDDGRVTPRAARQIVLAIADFVRPQSPS